MNTPSKAMRAISSFAARLTAYQLDASLPSLGDMPPIGGFNSREEAQTACDAHFAKTKQEITA